MTSKIKNITMPRDSAYLRQPLARPLQLRLGLIRPRLRDRCHAALQAFRIGYLP